MLFSKRNEEGVRVSRIDLTEFVLSLPCRQPNLSLALQTFQPLSGSVD